MQKSSYINLIVFFIFTIISVRVSGQTSPVTVTTILNYPPSIYLPDYYSSASNKLMTNIILNDFNEPSRDVYVNVRFESQDIKLYTKPDYYPPSPITLYPGEPVQLSGDNLEEYLNYDNLVLEGTTRSEMITRGGRLPEGFYNICVEVYDYTTKKLLSNTSCVVAHLSQFEPPKIIAPEKGKVVAPGDAQNIMFTWANEAPVNPANISYKFTLHELLEPEANPAQAIQNKKTVIVYEEELAAPVFNYNTSHPLLEVGKTYIFTVQVIDMDGKAMFKNNGVSEPSYFYYGYPGNGKIQLLSPEDKSALQLTLEKTFSWSAPDNILIGQHYNFEIRIAEADSARDDEEILGSDSLLYALVMPERTGKMNHYQNVKAHFPTGKSFIWQVKAYSGEQEIAKSEIAMFGGPPCVLDFIAADEYIKVTFTDGCDLSNLSGTGKVKINEEGEEHDVWFNNVRIEKDGVQYYLREGQVLGKIDDMPPIKLKPEFDRNGEALFYPDSLKITRYDYKLKGQVEWKFPHAVEQEEAPVIASVLTWLSYSSFHLLGELNFPDSLGFDLLDPMNFRLDFAKGSRFYIRRGHQYFIDFTGTVTLPESVTGPEGNTIVVPFGVHEQIFNVHSVPEANYPVIHVANKTTLNLEPEEFVFDFDNEASPKYFKGDPLWRGFYVKTGKFTFEGDYKFSKQFASTSPIAEMFDFDKRQSDYAYIVADGLYVKSDIGFKNDNKLFFNTFPALLNNFHIDVEAGRTKEGQITGDLIIPLLSDKEDFPFTCKLNHYGFQPGYLDEAIEDKTFHFNKGSGEQALNITFNRGYFADNERIESTITIEWPYLGITFDKIPAFRIWGNYDIGFGMPNGAFTLSQQLQTKIKGYEVTIDGIGAGRQGNLYSIGTTAKIVMAEDVAGEAGPPIVNFYSIFESSKIDEAYILGNSPEYSNKNTSTENSGSYSVDENIGSGVEGMATVGDVEAMIAKYEQRAAEAKARMEALKPKPIVGRAVTTFDPVNEYAELLPTQEEIDAAENPLDNLTLQDLIQIIDYIAPFLEKEQQDKVYVLKDLLVTFSPEEINAVREKLSDIRGLLNGAIKSMIDAQVLKVTKPLKVKVGKLQTSVEKTMLAGSDSLVGIFGKGIDELVDGFADGLLEPAIGFLPLKDPENAVKVVEDLASSTKFALKGELKRTVRNSVKKNIVVPTNAFIDSMLYTGTIIYLANSLSNNAANLITDPDFNFKDIDVDIDGLVKSKLEMFSGLSLKSAGDKIGAIVEDAYHGFNWDSVGRLFTKDLLGATLEEAIKQELVKATTEALGETAGMVVDNIAQNVELDFSNIGDKLKRGDLKGIIKFDPTYIKIRTPYVDLEGYVNMKEDDPVWGDCFQAELMASIKVPPIPAPGLPVYAKYINGTKPKGNAEALSEEEQKDVETFKYWFIELGVKKLNLRLGLIPLAITEVNGKIYHHMVQQSDYLTYLPGEKVRYGAGLRTFMVDDGAKGRVASLNVGLELQLQEDGFIIELNGSVKAANIAKTTKEGDLNIIRSFAEGTGFLRYNCAEKHFLGNFTVETKASPIVCSRGEMNIDISKDWWGVSVGTREKPLGLAIFCKDTIFRGWFDINKTGLDMGLMKNIDLNLHSPWINIGIAKFRGWARYKYDFETELVMAWNPKFEVQKARVYMDFYTGVGIDYKTPPLYKKTRKFTIASVNYGGTLEFATAPEAYLYGEVHGSITVLNKKAGLSMEVDIKF